MVGNVEVFVRNVPVFVLFSFLQVFFVRSIHIKCWVRGKAVAVIVKRLFVIRH